MTDNPTNESSQIEQLLPERVRNVNLYDPLRKPIKYDLSDNTSQWGMAAEVSQEIVSLVSEQCISLSRYPQIYGTQLKSSLASVFADVLPNTSEDNFIVGCGTDDVLDCIIRACTNEDEVIVSPSPSFPMAKYFGTYNGRKVVDAQLNLDGSIDVENLLKFDAKLLYLCTPNNPTGLSINREGLAELISKYAGIIVIDEAYSDFAQSDCLDLLRDNPRVIIMRTFSKLHALAGLRIGFAIANRELISAIEAVRGPYKANVLALAAAQKSLTQTRWLQSVVDETKQTRAWFIDQLLALGFNPLNSEANFVFIRLPDTFGLKDLFERKEIAVRIFEDLPLYGSGIRVTIAPKEIMQLVLDVLSEFSNGK